MTADLISTGVAYHEAAHAVVAWMLGYEIHSIKIAPADQSGQTQLVGDAPPPLHRVMIALAGKAGQTRFNPASYQFRDGDRAPQAFDDVRHVYEALQAIAPDNHDEHAKIRANCRLEVEGLLDQTAVWALIERVAAILLDAGKMDASQFAQIVPQRIMR